MNTIIRSLVYCFLTLLAITPLTIISAADCIPAEGEPIRLGAIFPEGALFTSENSTDYQGVQAMGAAFNACGGVNGRPIEWVYAPAASRTQAANAAQRLIDEEGVTVIVGSGLAAVDEGAREVAEEKGVVYWEVTEAVEPGGEWFFSPRPTSAQLGALTGQFVAESLPQSLGKTDLRVALIYENRPHGQTIAEGIRDALSIPPIIEYSYTDHLYEAYDLAIRLREERIDVVVLAAFERDGDRLWFGAREADANVSAWIHVGSEGYKRGLCERLGNIEGFIGIDSTGPVSVTYRQDTAGDIYTTYRQIYMTTHSAEPTERADLAASGVYLLLKHMLPSVNGEFTAENIRAAVLGLNLTDPAGLMGEGLVFSDGINAAPGIIVQQQQGNNFCSIWPSAIATCSGSLIPFPTWVERAKMDELYSCGSSI